MKNSIYLNAKITLKHTAREIKRKTNDKPLIRQCLNDLCDSLIKDMRGLSDKRVNLYSNWLSSYTASLHPLK